MPQVFGLVAVIGAALYPIVVVPLQIQYSGGRKKVRVLLEWQAIQSRCMASHLRRPGSVPARHLLCAAPRSRRGTSQKSTAADINTRSQDPELQSGFQKKGMWGNIDAASKAQRGDQEGRAQR